MDFLEEYVYTDIKVIRDTKACAYDTIISVKVAREAFEDAQKFRNFIIGGNTKMTFENYLENTLNVITTEEELCAFTNFLKVAWR